MPVDPYTGEVLPYGPIDPYAGPWPPDPSWDNIVPTPTESPVPTLSPDELAALQVPEAPEAVAARAAADQVMAEPAVNLGFPTNPDERPLTPVEEALIVMGDEEPEAPPIDMTPDAVSGGQLEQPAALAPPEPAKLTDPNERARAEVEAEQKRIEGLSSADLAMEEFDAQQAAAIRAADQTRIALNERHAGERTAEEIYRKVREQVAAERAQIDAERARMANEKIDPDGWRSSRSTFQTIAMYVAGIVGGLMQSRNGGRNLGLEMIDTEINRYIAAQRENLAHRRQMLGERSASLADREAQAAADYRQELAFREAAFLRAADAIEADKQQFDPAGSAWRKREMFQRQLMAQAQQAVDEHNRALEDRAVKQADDALKMMKTAAEIDKLRAEQAKLQARGAGGGGTSASKQKLTVAEWNQQIPGANVPVPANDVPRTLAEYRSLGETTKSLTAPTEQEKLALAEGEKRLFNPAAKPDAEGLRIFRNADNKPLITPRAKELQAQLAAVTTLAQLVAQQKELIEKNGGELNPRSDAAKVAKSNQAAIANILREANKMGTLDASALELANTIQGGDPTAFIGDASVALEQMLVQAELKMDNDLKSAGWSPKEGEAFRLPRYKAPKAERDPDYDALIRESPGMGDMERTLASTDPSKKRAYDAAMGKGLSEEQELGLRDLSKRAESNDAAMEKLVAAAQNAANPAARTAAAQRVLELAASGNAKAIEALDKVKKAIRRAD